MRTMIDGEVLFDERDLQIEIESVRRECIERAAAGADGVLSIDLGSRSRKIRQRGTLRAASRQQIEGRIEQISAFIDGKTHTLVTIDGKSFCDVRMDSFEAGQIRESGADLVIDYEIIYMQLKV